jgi:putative oxidoreductase
MNNLKTIRSPSSMKTTTIDAPSDYSGNQRKSFTRFFPAIARILLGVPLVIFGLNGFLNFIKPPPDMVMPEKALQFSTALMESGYMMQLIGSTLLVSGVLLIINRFVPLALLFLAPFFVNSVLFHVFLEHSGLPMAVIFTALMLYLAWAYRAAYRPLFLSRHPAA